MLCIKYKLSLIFTYIPRKLLLVRDPSMDVIFKGVSSRYAHLNIQYLVTVGANLYLTTFSRRPLQITTRFLFADGQIVSAIPSDDSQKLPNSRYKKYRRDYRTFRWTGKSSSGISSRFRNSIDRPPIRPSVVGSPSQYQTAPDRRSRSSR